VQPSAKLTRQVLLKTAKIPNIKGHVAQEKNIRIAVESSIK